MRLFFPSGLYGYHLKHLYAKVHRCGFKLYSDLLSPSGVLKKAGELIYSTKYIN